MKFPDFDDALDDIRNSNPDPDAVRAAADAVRARLGLDEPVAATGRIENCAGFRARIPDFAAGKLSEAEALLVHDHTRECVPCRRALIAARVGAEAAPKMAASRTANPWMRYVAAAAAVAVLVLGGWAATRLIAPAPQNLNVAATDGGLWRLDNGTAVLLTAGSSMRESDMVRTERGSGAVLRMADGSRIEMRESTQFRVERRRDGATIRLAQGSIIVEASKQGSGHLDVATGDAVVSVKGTIFTVNAGVSGSRVAVLEGAVQFDSGGRTQLLKPGDQIASRPGLGPVSLHDAFGWSRDAARYDTLVTELHSLRADLEAGITAPASRTGSRLLDLVPANTVVYIGVPNFAQALGDATQIIRRHLEQSEELRTWWQESLGSAKAEADLEAGLAKLATIGNELGDEVVVTIPAAVEGRMQVPLFLATLKSPDSFRAMEQREGIGKMADLEFRIIDDLLVAGPPGTLPAGVGTRSAFASTSFHDRLAEAYRDGTGWIFGADLATMVAAPGDSKEDRKILGALGMDSARDLIIEREDRGDSARTSATLTFNGSRQGIASWLAEPGPMGGLAFVSPHATLVGSVLLREPGVAVRELFDRLANADPQFTIALDRFRTETGVDPVADLADPLGGELTFALDGPVLPTPAWKLVVEVYDPARLQNSIATLVRRMDTELRAHEPNASIVLESETVDGRTWHTLRGTQPDGVSTEAVYTFDRGYLVAAPNRALIGLALQTRDSGTGIAGSARFRAMLPADRRTDFSAIVFEDVDALLKPIAGVVGPAASALQPSAKAEGPTGHLFYAYAGNDRIELASDTSGGLGSEIARIFALIGLNRAGHAEINGADSGGGAPVR